MTPNMTRNNIAIWKYERFKNIEILLPKVTLNPKVTPFYGMWLQWPFFLKTFNQKFNDSK